MGENEGRSSARTCTPGPLVAAAASPCHHAWALLPGCAAPWLGLAVAPSPLDAAAAAAWWMRCSPPAIPRADALLHAPVLPCRGAASATARVRGRRRGAGASPVCCVREGGSVAPCGGAPARRMEGLAARGWRDRRRTWRRRAELELEMTSGAGGDAIPANTEGLGSASLRTRAR
jgi:hypothetical protein